MARRTPCFKMSERRHSGMGVGSVVEGSSGSKPRPHSGHRAQVSPERSCTHDRQYRLAGAAGADLLDAALVTGKIVGMWAGYAPPMHFDFVDAVLESSPDRIVTVKNVSASEEYLQDHFPSFPVLPGVFMIEAMAQAARRLLSMRDPALARHVLGSVRALKYGTFVRPGDSMRIEVSLMSAGEGSQFEFKGAASVVRAGIEPGGDAPTCVSGRFTLRPIHLPSVSG